MSNNRRMTLSFSKAELKRTAKLEMGNAGCMISYDTLRSQSFSKRREDSFGWFGNSSDSNKFYPGLDVSGDVVPKDADYVRAAFRLISQTIVAGGTWRATDFSRPGVLKASVKKLNDKTVYLDHDTDILNWVGRVEKPVWSDAFTMPDGTAVPGGIDGTIAIDAKVAPKVARGILSNIIFSNSVTVEFEWEPSHKFDDDYEFECNIGVTIDGKMVCRVVTKIIDYYESSLCWLGADPYAKLIDKDGNLVNVDTSSTFDDEIIQTEYKKYEKTHSFSIQHAFSKEVLSLSKRNTEISSNNDTENNDDMNPELLAQLRKILGLADDAEVTTEMLSTLTVAATEDPAAVPPTGEEGLSRDVVASYLSGVKGETVAPDAVVAELASQGKGFKLVKVEDFTALETAQVELTSQIGALAVEKATLTGEVSTLTASVADLTPKAAMGDKFIQAKREECKRLYNLSVDNKGVPAIIAMIDKASVEELDGLNGVYTKGQTERFSGKCKKCGSTDFEFRSSVGGEEAQETTDTGTVSAQANAMVESVHVSSIYEALTNKRRAEEAAKVLKAGN